MSCCHSGRKHKINPHHRWNGCPFTLYQTKETRTTLHSIRGSEPMKIKTCFMSSLMIAIFSLLLVSCSTTATPSVDAMIPDVLPLKMINADIEHVSFSISSELKDRWWYPLKKLEITSYSSQWERALIDTIKNSNRFNRDSKIKLNLSVTVLNMTPIVSFMSTRYKVNARYQITEINTGSVIYSNDIETVGIIPPIQNIGVTDSTPSAELAINENIKKFMDSLVVPEI